MHTAAFKMGNQQGPTVKQKKKREREILPFSGCQGLWRKGKQGVVKLKFHGCVLSPNSLNFVY